jgi:hypothetical protein
LCRCDIVRLPRHIRNVVNLVDKTTKKESRISSVR